MAGAALISAELIRHSASDAQKNVPQFVQRAVKNKIIQNILAQVRLRLLPLICHKRVLHNCGLYGLQIATVPSSTMNVLI